MSDPGDTRRPTIEPASRSTGSGPTHGGASRQRLIAVLALRVAVVVIAVALAAIPFVVLFETVFDNSVPAAASLLQVPTAPPQPVSSSQSNAALTLSCTHSSETIVVVTLHALDVDDGSVTAHVSICLGTSVARQILHQGAIPGQGPSTLTISGLESNLVVPLVPLARGMLNADTGALAPVGSVTLALEGYPRAYPLDRYVTEVTVEVNESCSIDSAFPTVFVDPGASSLDWTVSSPRAFTGTSEVEERTPKGTVVFCGGSVGDIVLQARRPLSTKLFVLCLVGIPLLLIGLLALRLTEGTPRSVDGLVGVTAIMLAILPIRTVLVPGDISTLTLVDFALASEMALLATGTVVWFVWPRRAGRPG